MTILPSPTKQQWEEFVGAQPHTPLLQSWAWGEFQRRVGRPPVRFVFGDGQVRVAVQALRHQYRGGFHSLYIPHGPVFSSAADAQSKAVWEDVLKSVGDQAKAEGDVFVRIEPNQPVALPTMMLVRSVESVQPKLTHVLDLHKSEEELLAAMHQKTRYNIRLAEKHGVVVEAGGGEFLEDFIRLSTETEAREKVKFFSPNYFRQLWQTPELVPHLTLYRARLHEQLLAAIIVITFGDTAVYLHGGSGREAREHMAPYLLQWTAIRQAKAAGVHWYDFRGVAPADAGPAHPWAGFSRFKRGFGGVDFAYPGAYDWVRRPALYALYRLAQRVR